MKADDAMLAALRSTLGSHILVCEDRIWVACVSRFQDTIRQCVGA